MFSKETFSQEFCSVGIIFLERTLAKGTSSDQTFLQEPPPPTFVGNRFPREVFLREIVFTVFVLRGIFS
jgi:hypothetical protein